ncbi:MAG: hypothetical protein ACOZBH_03350 [Patescibacteria group bacterium]
MQKIIAIPNIHLPSSSFVVWAQNLSNSVKDIDIFNKSVVNKTWAEMLTELSELVDQKVAKGTELYMLTEGWGILPALAIAESHGISGIFSIHPIIYPPSTAQIHPFYQECPKAVHLIERSQVSLDLFMPEKAFENNHRRSIKFLKSMSKPNVAVKPYEQTTLYSSDCLGEIERYILYKLGKR